jgi:hypothetical protein
MIYIGNAPRDSGAVCAGGNALSTELWGHVDFLEIKCSERYDFTTRGIFECWNRWTGNEKPLFVIQK